MSSATTAMPRNDSAAPESTEFELVLGNKQLLSVFFIVVVLLGVFFTMGYIVGRNSAPVDGAGTKGGEAYERTDAPSAMPATKSQAPVSAAEQPAAASIETAQPTQETAQTETPAAPARPIEIPVVAAAQPQAGQTYLQVVAVARTEADVLAEVLGKKGFRAFVAPVENNARLFRVLVGPASDINDVSRLKGDLEAAGFKPFVKKY
jgi:cell division septation protein DedD